MVWWAWQLCVCRLTILVRVSGLVNDPAGAPVAAASVALSLPGSTAPQFATKTTAAGTYAFAGVRAGEYDLSVEAPGFSKSVIRNVRVGAGLQTPVQEIKLEVATVSSVVEVQADSVVLQTANAEITSVIISNQLSRLPTANRSPLALLATQAGFGSNGRANTTINGLRVSYASVTLDGINIQDNFIRSNGLDFLPNLLRLDQVAEVTLSTSNANPSLGNGAAQITFTTPSGTNKYKGGVFWFDRNNEFAANPWFSNANGTPRPFLNQNQIGGSLGGPIKKDTLFFYTNYEAFRLRQQSAATRVILTESARHSIFTYLDTANNIRQVDMLPASGLAANPTTRALIDRVPGAANINRRDVGDFNAAAGRHLNIGGYQFNVQNNRTRDNATLKLDYVLNSKQGFSASYIWNCDIVDRPDLAYTYQVNRLNGNVSFYRNRNALGTNMMTNYSNGTYHSLQIDHRRRYEKGFEFQINHVFSKSLSDTLGDAQARFEPFLDINNPSIEKAPSPFDQRHALKANGVYELPFGRRRRWDLRNPVLNQMFGGSNLSGIFTLTSGSPFGIYSGRGTLNRAARSGVNTVNTTLNYEQLEALTDVRKVGNGVYFLQAGVIGPDGRGSAADGRAPFNGQVFFHPQEGTLGSLQRRNLYGPRFINLDFSGEKQTRITERLSLTLRMEALNATNTPSFFIGDQFIDNVNFGRITSTQSARRVVQFGAYLRF